MANAITIRRGNSKTIDVSIPDCISGATGYTCDFLVSATEGSGVTLFSVTGNTIYANYQTFFFVLPEHTENLKEKVYFYQIDLVKTDERVTTIADTFTVTPAITE